MAIKIINVTDSTSEIVSALQQTHAQCLTKLASAGPRVAEGPGGQRLLTQSGVVPAQVPHLDHTATEKHEHLQLPNVPFCADKAF